MEVGAFVKLVTWLIAVVNPLEAVPTYLAVTSGCSQRAGLKVALTATMTVLTLLAGAAFLGVPVLNFFQINLASFRIAGGILLMVVALGMFSSQPREPDQPEEAADNPGVVPIGLPLLAGPGAIAATILAGQEYRPRMGDVALLAALLITALAVLGVLYAALKMGRFISRTGINIMTRLMGLFIAAIAVEFILEGLARTFPALR
ncbi:MAG TPA: MarC family protein [Candidatus Nitrosotenuis sp.]|jgi:multiple antibiotic resistance protein|nr:MarC family protein [Candidatus Nitrosotenuis sp.]